MKNLLSSADVQSIDLQSQERYKIPALVMMENAGLRAWDVVKKDLDVDTPLVVVAGAGNNGGDGLVMARQAINDGYKDLTVVLLGSHISDSCKVQRDIIEEYGIPCFSAAIEDERAHDAAMQAIATAGVIIDAIAGTGIQAELKGIAVTLVMAMNNNTKGLVYSVDAPSGMGDHIPTTALHVKASATLCMGPAKSLFYHPSLKADCGEIIEINPSFPLELVNSKKPSSFLSDFGEAVLEPLPSDAYKKDRGHLAIYGGCSRYTGAIRLASRSAFVSRVGLVTAVCDKEIYPIVAGESPSVIVKKTEEVTSFDGYSALLAGPGWGEGREDQLDILLHCGKPIVVDADGIRTYASLYTQGRTTNHGTLILTPHLGELRALCKAIFPERSETLGKGDTPFEYLETLSLMAARMGAIIVAKSNVTYVATAARKPIAIAGDNPSLGVAGSGDVLAGCIAGLLAGGLSPYKSALYGVIWHQRAGLEAYHSHGYYASEDLITYLAKEIVS